MGESYDSVQDAMREVEERRRTEAEEVAHLEREVLSEPTAWQTNPAYVDQETQRAINRESVEDQMQVPFDERGYWQGEAPGSVEPLDLGASYVGEDQKAGWRDQWALKEGARWVDPDSMTTHYMGEAEREQSQARVSYTAGILRDSDGAPLDGNFGWVMDPDRKTLYLFEPDKAWGVNADNEWELLPYETAKTKLIAGDIVAAHVIHHSTPVAGMPVLGAGLLQISNGQLTMINESSGHYRPDAEHLHASLSALEEQGAQLGRTVVDDQGQVEGIIGTDIQLTGALSEDRRPTGKQWIAEDPSLPQGTVHLRPEQFLQTQGNEEQIRRKIALNEEFRRQHGVRGPEQRPAGYQDPPDEDVIAPSAESGDENEGERPSGAYAGSEPRDT
jgi:hypothetical protein